MILAHNELIQAVNREDIICTPFKLENVGANSIDVTLGNELLEVLVNSHYEYNALMTQGLIDMRKPAVTRKVAMAGDGWIIHPGRLYLGTTVETVGSDYYVPLMHGRSTPARSGFSPIVSAGYGDIGFIGQWTLEITTVAHPMIIRPGDRIAQIEFQHATSADYNYRNRGHYAGQVGVKPGEAGNI